MSIPVRDAIRADVLSTLTGLTTTGSNAFLTRFYPLSASKLPGLAIYSRTQPASYDTMTPSRSVMRTLQFIVDAHVKAASGAENTIDTICAEVTAALTSDLTRGGYARDTRITGFTIDFDANGEQPALIGRLNFECDYVNLENDLETAV